jgi:hypothetical protein
VCFLWLLKPCQEWTLQRVGHPRPSRQCLMTTGESFTGKPLIVEAVFQSTGNLTRSTALGPGSYFSIEPPGPCLLIRATYCLLSRPANNWPFQVRGHPPLTADLMFLERPATQRLRTGNHCRWMAPSKVSGTFIPVASYAGLLASCGWKCSKTIRTAIPTATAGFLFTSKPLHG